MDQPTTKSTTKLRKKKSKTPSTLGSKAPPLKLHKPPTTSQPLTMTQDVDTLTNPVNEQRTNVEGLMINREETFAIETTESTKSLERVNFLRWPYSGCKEGKRNKGEKREEEEWERTSPNRHIPMNYPWRGRNKWPAHVFKQSNSLTTFVWGY